MTFRDIGTLRTLPDGRTYAGVPDVGDIPGITYGDDHNNCSPHGEPWLKCCDECAFKDRPQIEPIETAAAERGAAFYCVHREDGDGRYRVCAGFAARDRRNRVIPVTPDLVP